MQDAEDVRPFGLAQCPRLWRWRPRRPWWRWTLAVASIVRGSRAAQRRTGGALANDGRQFGDRLIDHHFGSPPVGSALPVASCSSIAESFRWTSITLWALPNSACKRATSWRSRATSRSRASAGGRPRVPPNASRAPSSRCRRHSEIDDVYNPARRSSALRPSRSRRSYSARILSLYCAENTRRLARSGTSGSAGSSTGSACRPDTSVVINIDGHLSDALRLANFGVRPASPNVDTE